MGGAQHAKYFMPEFDDAEQFIENSSINDYFKR
jgi:hypothetical protein